MKTHFILMDVSWSWAGQNSNPRVTKVPAGRMTLALLLSLVESKHWSPQQTISAFTLASCVSSPPKKILQISYGSQSLCVGKLLCKSSPKYYKSHSHCWDVSGSEAIDGGGCGERRVCWSGSWSHSFEEWTVTETLNKQLSKCLRFCPAKPGSCRCGAHQALGHTVSNLSTHLCPHSERQLGGKESKNERKSAALELPVLWGL